MAATHAEPAERRESRPSAATVRSTRAPPPRRPGEPERTIAAGKGQVPADGTDVGADRAGAATRAGDHVVGDTITLGDGLVNDAPGTSVEE